MRITLPAATLALLLATVSSVAQGQKGVPPIDPRSVALTQQGIAAQRAGQFQAATDALETALAVDPHNRPAFLALAAVARGQGLPGKAIRLYREALLIEPKDVAVLAAQGEVLVQKGAVERAKVNLARIKTLCANGCGEVQQLAAAIAKGPPPVVQSAQAAPPKPVSDRQ